VLVEHRDLLNNLPLEEQRSFAANLVTSCPALDLKHFGRSIEALRTPVNNTGSFYTVLSESMEIRQRMNALLDPRNPRPYKLLLEPELNIALFTKYKEHALSVCAVNELEIAERLALVTPIELRAQVCNNVKQLFPEITIAQRVERAFSFRNAVDTFLLSTSPELFFSKDNFDIPSCHIFSTMVSTLLQGKEREIGVKLANKLPADRRELVLRLGQIPSRNPFTAILSAMTDEEERLQANTSNSSVQAMKEANPNGFFKAQESVDPNTQSLDTKEGCNNTN
ncbi:MAG: hypothetical protein ACHP6H_02820, partial [Legionellales bacterium]